MSKNPQKELFNKVVNVCVRAENLRISTGQRIDRIMDVENAVDAFNIDIDSWLEADDQNFAHDYAGIVSNIRRNLGINHKYTRADFKDCFVPRFAREQEVDIKKEVIQEAREVSSVSGQNLNVKKVVAR